MMRWDEITKRLSKIDDLIIGAEIGVWQGENASKLLELNQNLNLILIDQWSNDNNYILSGDGKSKLSETDFLKALQKTIQSVNQYFSRVMLLCKSSFNASIDVAKTFDFECLDFVFIDANHSYQSVKEDINLWWNMIRKGGFISGHDYGVYPGVKQAVDELFNNVELGEDYTWFVTKDK